MPALTDKYSSPLLWFISAKRLLFFSLHNKDDDYVSVISFLGVLNWIQISSLLLYQFVPALCLFFSFCYNCASNTLFKIWNLIEYPEYNLCFSLSDCYSNFCGSGLSSWMNMCLQEYVCEQHQLWPGSKAFCNRQRST